MELSGPQFEELLRQFESNPCPNEVRRRPRILTRRRLTIITDPQDASRPLADVVLQDISPTGLAITHHTGMPTGKQFQALLPVPGGGRMTVTCTVRHCQMLKQHLFRIGAEFDAPA